MLYLGWWNNTNGIVTKYVYGLGLIGEEKLGNFKTYHFDYRGSTVAITDAYGNITDTFEYDTYGNLLNHVGDSFVIFGYNGRDGVVTDSNGLIYMRARYYAPHLKRFVNADLVHGELSNAVTLNRYAYANGNPVSFVDPFGLSAERGQQNQYTSFSGSSGGLAVATTGAMAAIGYIPAIISVDLGTDAIDETNVDLSPDSLLQLIVKYVAQLGMEKLREALSKIDVTYSRSLGGSVTFGIASVGFQGGWAIDTDGNFVIQGSLVGNFVSSGSFGLAAYGCESITNAPSVQNLAGESNQIGGAIIIPIPYTPIGALAGGDINFIPDPKDEDITYFGLSSSFGISTPGVVEFHAGLSETWNSEQFKFNIFDESAKLFNYILEKCE